MNKHFIIVAKAKHTLMLRGNQYKIGDTIPTEITQSEYEFYKDALNIESLTETFTDTTTLHNGTKVSLDYSSKDISHSNSSQIISLLNDEIYSLKNRLAEFEKNGDSSPLTDKEEKAETDEPKSVVNAVAEIETETETEVKPAKRPYNKKDKE